jgi:diadenosine tetraphosphate (Ap4A) HIT family hydrolase
MRRSHSTNAKSDDLIVYLDDQWKVEHCRDVPVPGYLILKPVEDYHSIASLSPELKESLGNVLSKCVNAVEQAVRPERVYTACFNESDSGVHFHVFPRMREMSVFGVREGQALVDGPLLLSQVRDTLRRSDPLSGVGRQVADAVGVIRSLLGD